MKTITLKIITPPEIEKKIKEEEKFIVYFTKNTFQYFRAVQNIFFKNNIGWFASGCHFLDLELERHYLALHYDGETLTFEDLDDLYYGKFDEYVFEEYIFSPFGRKKKLFI